MSQGSFNPKIRFLGQKVCSAARLQTDRQTDMKVTTVGTHSGFQDLFLQPIIKDRPNILWYCDKWYVSHEKCWWLRLDISTDFLLKPELTLFLGLARDLYYLKALFTDIYSFQCLHPTNSQQFYPIRSCLLWTRPCPSMNTCEVTAVGVPLVPVMPWYNTTTVVILTHSWSTGRSSYISLELDQTIPIRPSGCLRCANEWIDYDNIRYNIELQEMAPPILPQSGQNSFSL